MSETSSSSIVSSAPSMPLTVTTEPSVMSTASSTSLPPALTCKNTASALGILLLILLILCGVYFWCQQGEKAPTENFYQQQQQQQQQGGGGIDTVKSDADMQQKVTTNKVLVCAFVANGCSWCQKFKPEYQTFAAAGGGVKCCMAEASAIPKTLEMLKLSGFPCTIKFVNGKVAQKAEGYMTSEQLREKMSQ